VHDTDLTKHSAEEKKNAKLSLNNLNITLFFKFNKKHHVSQKLVEK
jgi:hypothetical protein